MWGLAHLGLDIVSVNRVRRLLDEHGERFFSRMLTEGELDDCRLPDGTPTPHGGSLDPLGLCGRIAAKEAAFKTLRVGGRLLPWRDIVVRRSGGGWPLVELRRAAAAMAEESGIVDITVSISHDVDYAVAVAAPVVGTPGLPAGLFRAPVGTHPVLSPTAPESALRSSHMSETTTDRTRQIRDWLLARHPERTDIDPELDLIENRLIDSLSFVEFVFLLEQLSGQSIEMETLDVDSIRTLAAIERSFLRAEVG
ncbi:4'-phosphopantetheinyl transferase superfamily protein [Streptomyces sp. AJS327]|uniref:4'-phosphopantetheinyl transferase superfamily protein n=1 Tax=Streptomyces sp. AJS327 TaxID=2545265 RepID=UPI0015DEF755|nr:4'-phosphopantetheinyl transferase superfamily protein [Streptomyces sp. AJS327]MBA0053173.1 4'-phosphopantetheinyl transferase superfamily protein [Streptomyces sp. AJS327]